MGSALRAQLRVQSDEFKGEWIYRFFSCTGNGLAGGPRYAGPPNLPFAGLQSALGSLPSVALSSAGANCVAPLLPRV
jgi:hypothetical protein